MNKKNITLFGTAILVFTVIVSLAIYLFRQDGEDSVKTGDNNQTANTELSDSVKDERSSSHEEPSDYIWSQGSEIKLSLNGDTISAPSSDVTLINNVVAISTAGNYRLSGKLNGGQLLIDAGNDDIVRLILENVDITSSSTAPIYVKNAEKVIVILADGSENFITDSNNYVYTDGTDEPKAAIYSAADLTIYGEGKLTVSGNYNDAISSKDGVVIVESELVISSVDDGIRGKDYLISKNADITVNAKGDALKSDNEEDAARGYIEIAGGNYKINSGDKGISGKTRVIIEEGNFTIDSDDDAIHSDNMIEINSGKLEILAGDDAIHADNLLTIHGGDILIKESIEGLEASILTINGGSIDITSSDDGINAVAAESTTGQGRAMGWPGGQMNIDTSNSVYINGGNIKVNALGDGVDVNGSIVMTGGVLVVNGPSSPGNGALDFDGNFTISGGELIAIGSSGMAQAPGTQSSQNSILMNLDSQYSQKSNVVLRDSAGNAIAEIESVRNFQSVVVSSPSIKSGSQYVLEIDGTEVAKVTISSISTTYGNVGGMQGGRGRRFP